MPVEHKIIIILSRGYLASSGEKIKQHVFVPRMGGVQNLTFVNSDKSLTFS